MRLTNDDAGEGAHDGQATPGQRVPSGFPSPAEEAAERRLDLNERLIRRPASTYFLLMASEAMTGAGILAGDLLIVDRALSPLYGAIVAVALDGELLVRRYCPDATLGYLCLMPASEDFAPIYVQRREDCQVWGVVTAAIHEFPLGQPDKPDRADGAL